jgi:uncharacterized protein
MIYGLNSFDSPGVHPYDTRPMSRPGHHRDEVVDATTSADTGTAWNRSFTLAELPRLQEAGALSGTAIDLNVHSLRRDGRLELNGGLDGELALTCQRCLQPVRVVVHEPIALRVVRDEEQAAGEGDHDYVIADPARLDLRWLSEEQALLAMPLVPMHEPDECPQGTARLAPEEKREQGIAQSPFANLRDMLDKS